MLVAVGLTAIVATFFVVIANDSKMSVFSPGFSLFCTAFVLGAAWLLVSPAPLCPAVATCAIFHSPKEVEMSRGKFSMIRIML